MKKAIKNAVAEAAKAYGAEGYEVKMGSSTSAAVEALKDDISSVTYEKSTSISVRCVKGGKSGYASGNIVTPEEAAELVRRACESALVVDDADEVPLFEGSPEYKEVEKVWKSDFGEILFIGFQNVEKVVESFERLGQLVRNVKQSYEKRNYKGQNGVLVQIVAVDNLYFLIFVWDGAPDIKFRIFFCIVQILLVCLGRKSQGRSLST